MPPPDAYGTPARPSRLSASTVVLIVIAAFVAAFAVSVLVCAVTVVRTVTAPMGPRLRPRRSSRPLPLPMLLYARDQVADPARNRQINLYVRACLNPFSAEVLRSRMLYLHTFSEAGPPGLPADALVLTGVVHDPADCETALRRATTEGPRDPALEAAGQRYLAALRVAAAALNDAYPYYRNRDWQDDAMARGRAMHPGLVAAFDAFGRAHDALAALVEAAQQDAPPCGPETDGRSFVCQRAQHLMIARRATRLASRATVAADGTIAGLDPVIFTAAVAALDTSVRRLVAAAAAYDRQTGEFRARDFMWNVEEHLRQVKALFRAARDGERVEAEAWETPDLDPPGSPSRIIGSFNDVVNDFNWPI